MKVGANFEIVDKSLALSESFWHQVILPQYYENLPQYSKLSFAKHVLRWDVFEEQFLAFILNRMDIEDIRIKKVSIYR